MNKYSLPLESLPLNDNNAVIDMSDLNFPVEKEKQNRTSLLYIRNTGLSANFDFTNCSFDDKSDFLLLYLNNNRLNIDIPIIVMTWVNILTYNRFDPHLDSILTKDEIKLFYDKNQKIINELHIFFVSIALCSINLYNYLNTGKVDISEFPKNNFKGFNPYTLLQLFDYKPIIMLADSLNNTLKAEFYTYYFDINSEPYPNFINALVNKFPYYSLLSIIMSKDLKVINSFCENVESLLKNN